MVCRAPAECDAIPKASFSTRDHGLGPRRAASRDRVTWVRCHDQRVLQRRQPGRTGDAEEETTRRWRKPIGPMANALRKTSMDLQSALTAQTQKHLVLTLTTRTPPALPNRTSLHDGRAA